MTLIEIVETGVEVSDLTSPTIVEVFESGVIAGGTIGTSVQEFTQSVAASTWTFNHTLNRRPMIQVTDLVGNGLIIETQVTNNQAIVRSETPVTGIVYLS